MVERGPEKAGVGGSIPSLGIFVSISSPGTFCRFKDYFPDFALFCNIWPHTSTSIAA
jgi:hypothetical protein